MKKLLVVSILLAMVSGCAGTGNNGQGMDSNQMIGTGVGAVLGGAAGLLTARAFNGNAAAGGAAALGGMLVGGYIGSKAVQPSQQGYQQGYQNNSAPMQQQPAPMYQQGPSQYSSSSGRGWNNPNNE
ncbi:MAG: hypothetical protein HQK81_15405 [Desulfovibrionaceae bacterium]|nr:hypothetical protein [Desulfovibrionaceae bacterium]